MIDTAPLVTLVVAATSLCGTVVLGLAGLKVSRHKAETERVSHAESRMDTLADELHETREALLIAQQEHKKCERWLEDCRIRVERLEARLDSLSKGPP